MGFSGRIGVNREFGVLSPKRKGGDSFQHRDRRKHGRFQENIYS